MEVKQIRTPGLGDSTYIFTHEGQAVLVDPQRDYDRFLDAIEETGADLRYILETHLHNDYISGGREIAAKTGAELVLPSSAAPAYKHTPAFHKEAIGSGAFSIEPLHTPGHTPEHTSYVIYIDGMPTAIFSGGSLLVGSAGRPDLLGPERKESLAMLQYISVNRLAAFPDETPLFPTHGEGSFCTAGGCGRTVSTIGQEKEENALLQVHTVEEFTDTLFSGLGPWPTYYRHMGPGNTFGWDEAPESFNPPAWTADQLAAAIEADAVTVVDIRSKKAIAAGHVPGAVGLEMGDQVGVWSGWLLPFDASVVLVADEGQDVEEATRQYVQIGMDAVAGVMWGMDEWIASGREVRTYDVLELPEFLEQYKAGHTGAILDVRMASEFADGALEGSVNTYLPDLQKDMPEFNGNKEVTVVCRTGHRATAATKWLMDAGYQPTVLIEAGVPDVLETLS